MSFKSWLAAVVRRFGIHQQRQGVLNRRQRRCHKSALSASGESLESRVVPTVTTFDVGTLTAANSTYADGIQGSDIDLFRFQVAASSNVIASFSGLSDNIGIILVRDLNGNDQIDSGETVQSASFVSGPNFTMNEPVGAGDYLLQIKPSNVNDSTSYILNLSATIIANAQDAGSGLATAQNAGVLTTVAKSFIDVIQNGDIDVYRLQLTETSDLTAAFSGLSENINISLVQDLNGNNQIDSGETVQGASFVSGPTFTLTEPLSAGVYFIQLSPSNTNDNTAYTLSLSATAIANAVDAGAGLAVARDAGALTTSATNFVDVIQNGDLDVYRFQLTSASNLTSTFTNLSENVNLSLVRDLNGNNQIDSGETVQGVSFVSGPTFTLTEPLSSGVYFIQVSPSNTSDNSAYQLSLSAAAIAGAQDAGNSLGTALDAGILNTVAKNFVDVMQNGDLDYFRFQLTAASNLAATFTNLSENINIVLIQDLNGNNQLDSGETLQSVSFESGPTYTMSEPLNAGTYFIQISPSNTNDNTAYNLSLSAIAIANAQDAGSTLSTARNAGQLTTNATVFVDVIQNGDVDVFRFQLSASSVLTATFTGLSENVQILLVQDTNANGQINAGETIRSVNFESGPTYTLSQALAAGDFFIQVSPSNTSDNTSFTLSLNSNILPQPPVVNGFDGTISFTENSNAVILDPDTTVTDVDSADFNTGALTVSLINNGEANDRLEVVNQGSAAGQIGVVGTDITYGGTVIGVMQGGVGLTDLVVVLNSDSTAAAVQALIRNVTFRNVSEAPSTASRTVRVTLTDGDGGTSNSATKTINVTAINDVPVALASSISTSINVVKTFSVSDFQFNDEENNNLVSIGISGLSLASGDTLTVNQGAGAVAVTNGMTITAAQIPSLTYTPAADIIGVARTTFSFTVNDANAGTTSAVMTINVTPVNQVPVAQPSSITAIEDLPKTFTVANFLYSDFESNPLASITISGLNLANGDLLTVNQGAGPIAVTNGMTITAARIPTLTYAPAPNANGSGRSSFQFKVNDAGFGQVAALMSIHVTPANDVPVALANTVTTAEDTPKSFSIADFPFADVESDALVSITINGLNLASGDTLTVNQGAGTVDVVNGMTITAAQIPSLVFTPALNASGSNRGTIGFRVNDVGLGAVTATVSINVTAENDAPTDISLSANLVTENQPAGTFIGGFSSSDVDAGSTFSYALVSGEGSTDNASFVIVNGQLQTTSSFDFETKTSYAIRVSTTDNSNLTYEKQFTITVTNIPEAPTDIALSESTVEENQAVGTLVGTFSSFDSDLDNTFSYALVAGSGSADNARFTVSNDELFTANVFDFNTKSSYTIRVLTTDQSGLSFEKQLTIGITDVNESPTNVTLSTSLVSEKQPVGSVVGTFNSNDPDSGNSFTYALVEGTGSTDNSHFTISNGQLLTATVFDVNVKNQYSIRVATIDQGGLAFEKQFTITVVNANEAPTNLTLSSSSIAENLPGGSIVGLFSTTDPDAGGSFVYTLVTGDGSTDNSSFSIANGQLKTVSSLNYEVRNSYSIRVRTTDQGGLSFEKSFVITVNDVNEAPTNLALSATTIAENPSSNVVIGTFSSSDPDADSTATFTLVTGTGSADNGAFTIVGGQLVANSGLDFEAKPSYSIRVRATDSGGLFFERALTITVTNVNEAPTDILLSNTSVQENTPIGTVIGTLSSIDPELSGPFTYILTSGVGDTNNSSFTIVNGQLLTAEAIDFETLNSYSIRMRSTDQGGQSLEKSFALSVVNLNEAPTIAANQSFTVNENPGSNFVVGTVIANDPDTTAPFNTRTFSIASGNSGNAFAIHPTTGQLTVNNASAVDFESSPVFSLLIALSDGGGAAAVSTVVTIQVNDLNEAPTVSTIAPQSIDEDGVFSTISFTVGDIETLASNLTVEVTSSNPALIPNSNLLLSGAGAIRELVLQTLANQSGTANITVSVGDGTNTTIQSFTVTAREINDGPTISDIQSVTIQEDTATEPIAFTIGDIDTAVESLTVSAASSNTGLIPTGNIVISGTGANRTVVVTPGANASGTALITITVTDGALTSSQEFQVTVNQVDDPATITGNPQTLAYRTSSKQIVPIDSSVAIADPDSPNLNFTGAEIRISGQGAKDQLLMLKQGGIAKKGKKVLFNGIEIGEVAGGKKAAALTVKLNAAATQPAVQAVLRSIGFKSKDKLPGVRTIQIQIAILAGTTVNLTRQVEVTP